MAVMTSPSPRIELLLYIATSSSAMCAALVKKRTVKGTLKQLPIYFVSEALNGSKLLYSEMEKIAYAVVMAAKKLHHYFQSFKIKVPTSFPLRDMFENRDASGRIGKWATLLASHTIDFIPRSAIKSQVLADFVADWTLATPSQYPPVIEAIWQLECDGAYCKNGSGASAILTAPSWTQLKYAARLDFPGCTNNVVEYEGLLLGLLKARALGARRLSIKSDSELITNHIGKTYRALNPELAKYLATVHSMEKYFLGFSVRSFPRIQNKQADVLAKAATKNDPLPPDVFFETVKSGSVNCAEDPAKFVNAI